MLMAAAAVRKSAVVKTRARFMTYGMTTGARSEFL